MIQSSKLHLWSQKTLQNKPKRTHACWTALLSLRQLCGGALAKLLYSKVMWLCSVSLLLCTSEHSNSCLYLKELYPVLCCWLSLRKHSQDVHSIPFIFCFQLIYWTASILLSVIQFCECYHVQIFGTALILHLQWAMTSMWMLLMTQDTTTTVLVQLYQAESAIYSYSELSYVSAKLYRSSLDWWCIVQCAICRLRVFGSWDNTLHTIMQLTIELQARPTICCIRLVVWCKHFYHVL